MKADGIQILRITLGIVGALLTFSRVAANYLYDVGTTPAAPNVLIIFDTSGSMTFDTSGRSGGEGCIESGDGGGCATGGDGSKDHPGLQPTTNRMYIAKAAIASVLQSIGGARYGLMRFHQRESSSASLDAYWYRDDRGRVERLHYSGDRDPRGSDDNCRNNSDILVGIAEGTATEISTWMDGVENYPTQKELRGDGATPLARSLRTAREYFRRTLIPNDASRGCRRNYIILVTDGLETCGGDPCREAKNLRNVRVGGEIYDIKTYVVGLAIPEELRTPLDCIAEEGGTGEPLFANDIEELEAVLTEALNEIVAGDYNATTPTITTIPFGDPSLEYRIANNALLVPGFHLPDWRGSLKAYEIFYEESNGVFARHEEPLLQWDAGEKLARRASSEREIFTWLNGKRVDFTEENAALLNPYLGIPDDDKSLTETKRFIRYLRGVDAYDEDEDGDRSEDRLWKLGDIYHSTPVVVASPPYTFDDPSYSAFKELYVDRPRTLYVGANDGMLHAFDALTGEERWGFVPPSLLSKLYSQRQEHTYYVDLSPKVDDAKLGLNWNPENRTGWSTVLIVGQGWGGKSYTTLDISDPLHPHLLWEFSDPQRLGETWSVPAIGRVYYDHAERWVALFGSGFEPASKEGTLFIVDLATGTEIASYSFGPTSFVADPVLVNVDPEKDSRVDLAYFGDMEGRLYKLDLSCPDDPEDPIDPDLCDPSDWKGCRFYTFGSSKPIVSSPVVQKDEATDDLYIMIGSGDDVSTDSGAEQEFVVLRDDDLTDSCSPATKDCQVHLTTGERVMTTGTAEEGVLYFTTFLAENGSDRCTSGESFLRCIQFESCTESCSDIETGSTSAGEGKATDPVIADDHVYFALSTGTIVDIGDPSAPVNQDAPTVVKEYFYPMD